MALAWQLAYSQDMEILTPDEIARMSPSDRMALIAGLWNNLGEHPLPLRDSHRDELQRRLDSFEQDRTEVVPWADLQAELAARCP